MSDFDESKLEIEIVSGTTFDATLEVWDTDENGALTNLTDLSGWVAEWTIRECTETEPTWVLDADIDEALSTIKLELTSVKSESLKPTDYEHNVRISKDGVVRQLVWGPVKVKA